MTGNRETEPKRMHDGGTSRPDAEAQDSPIFDPDSWRLSAFEAALCAETRTLAQTKFAARAAEIDRQRHKQ